MVGPDRAISVTFTCKAYHKNDRFWRPEISEFKRVDKGQVPKG